MKKTNYLNIILKFNLNYLKFSIYLINQEGYSSFKFFS